MAWQGQITGTERDTDKLNIIIHYSNGAHAFDERFQVTEQPQVGQLENIINDRITKLDSLDAFEAKIAQPENLAKTYSAQPSEEIKAVVTEEVTPQPEATPTDVAPQETQQ